MQADNLEIISAENVIQMETIASIGGGSIQDLAYSPDGSWLAAGSSIGVWLYPADLNAPPQLLGKDNCGYRVVFSKDSKFLASPGKNGNIWFWKIDNGIVQDEFQLAVDDDNPLLSAIA